MKGFLSEDLLIKEVLSPIQLTTGVTGTYADVDIRGWNRALLVLQTGVWTDCDSVLVVTMRSGNVSALDSSDAVAGGTFTLTINAKDAADDEVWLADLDFLALGLTDRYIGFASTMSSDDVGMISANLILYERNGPRPVSQDNTIYKG